MKFSNCPRCHRESLFQTGAFWTCGVCSYAITHSALTIDERRSKNTEGSPSGSPR
jgi:ribosomal protein L37AE/L43A